MTDEEWAHARGMIVESFLFLIPDILTTDAMAEVHKRLNANRYWLERLGDRQWIQAGELLATGYGLRRFVPDHLSDATPTVKTDAGMARRLFNAIEALLVGTPADGPLPANLCLATRHNDLVSAPGVGLVPMNLSAALNLGVWLVALADPTLSDAVPLLLRVATR